MNEIRISTHNYETFTSISNIFIDRYMTNANGEYVKIYLYLMRILNAKTSFSVADVADHFDLTENDICRAIRYWAKQDILRLDTNEEGEVIGITMLPLSTTPVVEKETSPKEKVSFGTSKKSKKVVAEEEPVKEAEPKKIQAPKKPTYSTVAINTRKKEDHTFEDIIYEIETITKKTLSVTDLQTLLYIYNDLGFSGELLTYLEEYCNSLGKLTPRYMETVAIAWYQEEIQDVASAKEAVSRYATVYLSVLKALGISRAVTDAEKEFIDDWRVNMGFSQEMILEACKIALLKNPHNANFPYVNAILTNWKKRGVMTLEALEKSQAEFLEEKKRKSLEGKDASKGGTQFHQYKHDKTREDQLSEIEQLIAAANNQ